MFWIQKTGTKNDNSAYRLFYAEYENDINFLPTDKQVGMQTNGNTVANQKCSLGSECMVLETGMLYVLSTSGWNPM